MTIFRNIVLLSLWVLPAFAVEGLPDVRETWTNEETKREWSLLEGYYSMKEAAAACRQLGLTLPSEELFEFKEKRLHPVEKEWKDLFSEEGLGALIELSVFLAPEITDPPVTYGFPYRHYESTTGRAVWLSHVPYHVLQEFSNDAVYYAMERSNDGKSYHLVPSFPDQMLSALCYKVTE